MLIDKSPQCFAGQYKGSGSNHPCFQITVVILLSFVLFSAVTASPLPDKMYLRLAHGATPNTTKLNASSLGVLSLKNNMVGHVDISYLSSDTDGDALALDFGAVFAFNWYISPYISIGASLGYNWDKEETIAAYFPEVGVVADFYKIVRHDC